MDWNINEHSNLGVRSSLGVAGTFRFATVEAYIGTNVVLDKLKLADIILIELLNLCLPNMKCTG
jgi:hypothetical protein